mgnify:CR=1 FL=1
MGLAERITNPGRPTLAEQLGYSDKDILVIVNIDDVGMHEDEMEASIRAMEFGMVKTGSIMVPCPGFDRVMKWWRKNPEGIDLGIHLTLTCEWGRKYPWSPVLPEDQVPSLYNPEGIMWPSVADLLQHGARAEILMELEAQINKILDAGMQPSHLDHHMDFYYFGGLFEDVMELSRKYDLPMRVWRNRRYRAPFILKNNLPFLRRRGYVFPDTQMGIYCMGGEDQSLEFRQSRYYEHLRTLGPGVHNIKVHIALQTDELEDIMGSHHTSIRRIDYDVWSSGETRRIAEELGIVFIGFRPLQQLQKKLMDRR